MPTPTLDQYCHDLPAIKLPAGLYLVHNHIKPIKPIGRNGFRAWVTDDADRLEKCNCDFGGNENAEVNPHYRIESLS